MQFGMGIKDVALTSDNGKVAFVGESERVSCLFLKDGPIGLFLVILVWSMGGRPFKGWSSESMLAELNDERTRIQQILNSDHNIQIIILYHV